MITAGCRRMFWLTTVTVMVNDKTWAGGLWRGGIDGSGPVLLGYIGNASLLALDESSQLLFFVETVNLFGRERVWDICYYIVEESKRKCTIRLLTRPIRIRVVGNRVFWVSVGDRVVKSCDKVTANNLMTHDVGVLNGNITDFLIISPTASKNNSRINTDICASGALCSHICVPTPAGYLRCLCPQGYTLMSDGWNCG